MNVSKMFSRHTKYDWQTALQHIALANILKQVKQINKV